VTQEELKQQIQQFSLQEKQDLYGWLTQELEQSEANSNKTPAKKKNRELVERQSIGNMIYQLEMVKCGKERCKCTRGQLHGPYWYAYQRQGEKFKSTYIGKTLKLPEEKQI